MPMAKCPFSRCIAGKGCYSYLLMKVYREINHTGEVVCPVNLFGVHRQTRWVDEK